MIDAEKWWLGRNFSKYGAASHNTCLQCFHLLLRFLHYTSDDLFEHLGRVTSEWLSRGKHFISRRTVFDQIQLRILIWSLMKSLEDCAGVNVQSLVNSHCR